MAERKEKQGLRNVQALPNIRRDKVSKKGAGAAGGSREFNTYTKVHPDKNVTDLEGWEFPIARKVFDFVQDIKDDIFKDSGIKEEDVDYMTDAPEEPYMTEEIPFSKRLETIDPYDKDAIKKLLPHREPMLLIDELTNIKKLFSATAIVYVKKNSFYVQGHFPDQPVMPGVLIVEAFGQAAAALTAHGINPKEGFTSNNLNKALEVNALSTWRLIELFERIALHQNSSGMPKEIWVNTSEAEIQPALNPSYEISKRLRNREYDTDNYAVRIRRYPKSRHSVDVELWNDGGFW